MCHSSTRPDLLHVKIWYLNFKMAPDFSKISDHRLQKLHSIAYLIFTIFFGYFVFPKNQEWASVYFFKLTKEEIISQSHTLLVALQLPSWPEWLKLWPHTSAVQVRLPALESEMFDDHQVGQVVFFIRFSGLCPS